jgi:hypothetical protein
LAAVLAAAITASAAAEAQAAPPQRYVLIVANNRSLDAGVAPLRYADDDGARFWELFRLSTERIALFSVFDDETAVLFSDAARVARTPESGAILATLDRWNAEMAAAASRGVESELLFIYAGHGDVDAAGEGYVSLQDSKLRRRDLYQKILARSRASYVHLIIDACKSYFLVKRRGAGAEGWKDDADPDSHDKEVRAFLNREDLSAYPRAGVILATSGDQATHEWNRFRAGILSHELRSALSGSADINGDGRIEYSETHAFMAAANARVRHPEARLNVFVRAPEANRHRPLMDLRSAGRGRLLRFDAGLAGQFSLEDDRGVRYADLNKSAEIRFDMVLDRRRSYFILRDNQEARVPAGTARVLVSRLSFRDRALALRGSLEQSFRRDLYRVAYSRGFYDGFCARTGMVPVEGGAEEFVISAAPPARPQQPHSLMLGYMVSGALLDLPGAAHGLQLRYLYGLHRNVALGAWLEYCGSSHSFDEDRFRVTRVAALAGAVGRLWPHRRLALRAELALGYQGYFATGRGRLMGQAVEGSDPAGFRREAGRGAELELWSFLFVDLRGGVALELVKVEPQQYAHASPYGAIGVGTRF